MRRYPEHKESGVGWIGQIPEHWKVVRSKHLFGNRNQRGYEGEALLSVTQDQGVLPRNELDYRVWNPDGNIKLYKLVRPGDWVISLRTFEGGIELSEVRGIVSAAYTTMSPLRQIYNSYFKYLLKSVNFIAELNRITTGIRQGKNISYDDFSDTRIVFPPLSDQKAIGNFLDHKTGQIDELIRIKERRIELLQEQRTALINQVVTKGFDPNVEMKPSGVEWIGEIPVHWEVKKLRYFCSTKSGNGFSHDLQGKTGLEIPFFKVADTNTPENKVEMLHAQNTVSSQEVSDFKFITHKPNSIVFPKVGAALLLNKRNILTQKSCIDNNMMSLYSDQSDYKFLYYAMLNVDFKRHYRAGGTVPSINESEVDNIPIAYPTHSEQTQIADFLDHKAKQIDELMAAEGRKIELLKEYRQSLISEAVTGKIDVRNEV